MPGLPNTAHLYGTDPVPTWVQHLAAIQAFYEFMRQGIGQQDESELTISGGAVTPTRSEHTIDTEADAPSDDLTSVVVANFTAGQYLKLRAADAARKTVLKHAAGGSGQLLLQGAADFTLDDTVKWVLLKLVGTSWVEQMRWTGIDPVVRIKTTGFSTDGQVAGAAHRGRRIVYTGATARTLGFTAAATLGDDWFVYVCNDMSEPLTLDPNSSEAIDGATTLKLWPGDSTIVVCDGTGFRTVGLSRPRLWRQARTGAGNVTAADLGTFVDANGTFTLTLGALSGMPAGGSFLVKNSGAGTVTLDGNGAETIDGAATLALGAGESALVVATAGGWITMFRTVAPTLDFASQADMEAAASTTKVVPAGRVVFNPGVAKAAGSVTVSGGTPSLAGSFNVDSITDHGVGEYTINWTADFSNTNYQVFVFPRFSSGASNGIFLAAVSETTGKTAGACRIVVRNFSQSLADPPAFDFVAFGDR